MGTVEKKATATKGRRKKQQEKLAAPDVRAEFQAQGMSIAWQRFYEKVKQVSLES